MLYVSFKYCLCKWLCHCVPVRDARPCHSAFLLRWCVAPLVTAVCAVQSAPLLSCCRGHLTHTFAISFFFFFSSLDRVSLCTPGTSYVHQAVSASKVHHHTWLFKNHLSCFTCLLHVFIDCVCTPLWVRGQCAGISCLLPLCARSQGLNVGHQALQKCSCGFYVVAQAWLAPFQCSLAYGVQSHQILFSRHSENKLDVF